MADKLYDVFDIERLIIDNKLDIRAVKRLHKDYLNDAFAEATHKLYLHLIESIAKKEDATDDK